MKHAEFIQNSFSKLTKQYFDIEPNNLYEPVRYIMSLDGKRIRPLLALYACELFGGNIEDALEPSYGVELFHNFTLVHDDIMDGSDLRRGQPAVHTQYGLNAGILSGDLMMVKSLELFATVRGAINTDLFKLMSATSVEVYEGQQMDVDFETMTTVQQADYIEMIRLKTAVLLSCSLQMGAIVAGADEASLAALKVFGDNIGIAFQIQDDYLDSFGTAAVGKKIGGDILNNKKTLLQINAMSLSQGADKAALEQWWDTNEESEEKIEAVKAIFVNSGAKDATYNTMISYYEKAVEALESITVDASLKEPLLKIAKAIVTRSK